MVDPLIRQADPNDTQAIAVMCAVLWPDATADEHCIEIEHLLKTRMCGTLPATIFVAQDEEGRLQGFLQVGLRSHADGCDPAHPVGFVEGWFVYEAFRGRGLGRELMHASEEWAHLE